MKILHLSDTHIPAARVEEDGVDAFAALEGLLHDCRHLNDLGAVVVSGDVSDDGSDDGYRKVRRLVGEYAAARGIPQVYCPGNHDGRAAFAAALGTGHLGPGGEDVGTLLTGSGECAAASTVNGHRLITLDSSVPGEVPGLVSPGQLKWLQANLTEPRERGSVLVLHHPPINLGSELQRSVALSVTQG